MGSCCSDTSQERDSPVEMYRNTTNNSTPKPNTAQEHRRQQRQRRNSGQQAGGFLSQNQDADSSSSKKPRKGNGSQQARSQQWRPQPSPPPTVTGRLLQRGREEEPKIYLQGGASHLPYLPNQQQWAEPAMEIHEVEKTQLAREVESNKRKMQKMETEIESYKRRLQEMEAERPRLAKDAMAENRKLQEQIEAERTRFAQEAQAYKLRLREELKTEKTKLEQEVEFYKRSLQEMERQIAGLQRELQQSQFDYKNLRNSHEVLQGEHKIVISKNQDLLQRISSMASERMRSNNPCVEDLSDQYRHSAVLSSWQALMNGEYWTLYETALKQLPSEQHTALFLLSIMELGFKEAQYLQNGSKAFMDLMQSQRQAQSKDDPAMAALLDSLLKNENFREIVDSESKKVRKGGKATLPANAFQDFHAKIRREWRNDKGNLLERSHKFADEVLRLCFLMALQSPPMALVFDRPAGREMDALLYEPDGDRNRPRPWTVKFVLTPPLLRHEGGAVLCKGTVELH